MITSVGDVFVVEWGKKIVESYRSKSDVED